MVQFSNVDAASEMGVVILKWIFHSFSCPTSIHENFLKPAKVEACKKNISHEKSKIWTRDLNNNLAFDNDD